MIDENEIYILLKLSYSSLMDFWRAKPTSGTLKSPNSPPYRPKKRAIYRNYNWVAKISGVGNHAMTVVTGNNLLQSRRQVVDQCWWAAAAALWPSCCSDLPIAWRLFLLFWPFFALLCKTYLILLLPTKVKKTNKKPKYYIIK